MATREYGKQGNPHVIKVDKRMYLGVNTGENIISTCIYGKGVVPIRLPGKNKGGKVLFII